MSKKSEKDIIAENQLKLAETNSNKKSLSEKIDEIIEEVVNIDTPVNNETSETMIQKKEIEKEKLSINQIRNRATALNITFNDFIEILLISDKIKKDISEILKEVKSLLCNHNLSVSESVKYIRYKNS